MKELLKWLAENPHSKFSIEYADTLPPHLLMCLNVGGRSKDSATVTKAISTESASNFRSEAAGILLEQLVYKIKGLQKLDLLKGESCGL